MQTAEHTRKHTDPCLREAIADIAYNAGWMASRGEIEAVDSRELVSGIITWAEEFERGFDRGDDYILAVDEFAKSKLIEAYSKSTA